MRLLLLSEPSSSHTLKWARALADRGVEVEVFGLAEFDERAYRGQENVRVHTEGFAPTVVGGAAASLDKLRYLSALPRLRRFIGTCRPDLLHAHYATSYGLLGALAGFRPFVLSVWGSDVYEFPRRSLLHAALLRFNLARADRILSTSHVMARETRRYTGARVEVTPFGVDLQRFRPQPVESLFAADDIVIGTVKTLDEKYGIEYLIRAFRLVVDRHPGLPLRLLLVGGGPAEQELKALVARLGLAAATRFTGAVPFDQVPRYHNMLAISVSVSVADSESFGVAVIEAAACEKPVVVARVGGLPEVVEEGVTGFVVPPRDPERTAAAIERLIVDRDLRQRMGQAGRERVRRLYDWNENVDRMLAIYGEVLSGATLATGAGEPVPATDERARVEAAYERRERSEVVGRYAPGNPANRLRVEERDEVIAAALRAHGFGDLRGREILDVGCGEGREVERLASLGAERARLHGVDLLASRVAAALARAPDLDLRRGDATALPWPDASFDLELCYTLFSSVLDDGVRARIARELRRVLRPGGAIVWYDFQFDNPRNRDVRRVTRADLERLFPGARLDLRRVTLVPPLARLLVPPLPRVAAMLQQTRVLSTHLAGLILPA